MELNAKTKKGLMQHNIYECKHKTYKNLPITKSQKFFYNDNFTIAPPYKYCDVDVRPAHQLDIAYEFASNNFAPVVLNIVEPNFVSENIDSCENFKDPLINIRTNLIKCMEQSFGIFPLNEYDVLYTPVSYVIRNENLQFIAPQQLKKMSMITVSIKKYSGTKQKLDIPEYFLMKQMIECIFQAASHNNDVLIVNDTGFITDNYPIDDIIDIYNLCITKYGHLFKYVVFAIPIKNQSTMGYINKMNTHILRPQLFIQEFLEKEKTPDASLSLPENFDQYKNLNI